MVAAHEVMVRVVVWVTVEVVRGADEAPEPEALTEPVTEAETEAEVEVAATTDDEMVELTTDEVLVSSSHPGNSEVVEVR